ncbi:MAG: transcription elongation factor GreA [Alphaproteobacteria bacterium]|jgi:transcription elongation factor GreA|nr:transcription elongation factor GreA [Alphaproteobacteria bacterium]
MEKEPMTAGGYNRLEEELRRLKNEERPSVIKAIEVARAHGDLSENAEYHAAKERQAFIEGRLEEIESKVSRAEVIDPSTLSGTTVMFGATVTIVDEETDEKSTYQIVGTEEANIKEGLLSIAAPLARALIAKSVGESVDVQAPKGSRSYEILSLEYK